MKYSVKRVAFTLLILSTCLGLAGCRQALTDAVKETLSDSLNSVSDTLSDSLESVSGTISDSLGSLQEAVSEGLESLPSHMGANLDKEGYSLQQTIDSFCQAADSRDAEAIKALFSVNVRQEDSDLEEQIQRLFEFYSGPTEECYVTHTPGGSGHIGWRENTFTTSAWIPVVSQGVNYYCYISLTTTDQVDPNNLGIQKLIFVSEKVRCSEDFIWPEEVGLTVVEDAPGDYLTCRIGDGAYVYTPVDRVITREEIQAFLEENSNWEDFTAHFGPPNATNGSAYRYYELPDEDGEKRYANVAVSSTTGQVYGVYLRDGKSYDTLGTLWEPEEENPS